MAERKACVYREYAEYCGQQKETKESAYLFRNGNGTAVDMLKGSQINGSV